MKSAFLITIAFLLLTAVGTTSAVAQTHRMTRTGPKSLSRRVDYREQLPPKARRILDQKFTNWGFRSNLPQDQNNNAPLLVCQLNDDSIPDYALHIFSIVNSDTVEEFLAFVSTDESYKLFTLEEFTQASPGFGGNYLEVFKSGTVFDNPPFQNEGDDRKSFSTDCISVSMFDKNACNAYVFESGEFKVFSPCD